MTRNNYENANPKRTEAWLNRKKRTEAGLTENFGWRTDGRRGRVWLARVDASPVDFLLKQTSKGAKTKYHSWYTYICEQNGWNPRVCRLINWPAHSISLKKRLQHQAHYIKLVHGRLPTGKRQFRNDQVRSLCLACKRICEDWQHILMCDGKSRVTWRKDMVAALKAKCKSLGTRSLLTRVLIGGSADG
jgi:hypothetical protein